MTFTLPQVLVLFCALAAASFGLLALLLLRWNRARTELVLYATLAFAIAFWLATPLLTPVPLAISREILGRLLRALSFVLPAVGFLFLLRFLNLALTPVLAGLLVLPLVGTVLALFLPAVSPLVGGLSVVSVGLVSIGFLIVFGRKENRRRDTTLVFVATAFLLAGATLETGSRWVAGSSAFSGLFFGFAFLVFTALLLPTVADEERRLFARATTDALTGLLTPSLFLGRVAEELVRAERTRRSAALVVFAVDGFEVLEKDRGRDTADELLASFGQAIGRTIRGIDLAARRSRYEFLVLLVEADETNATIAVERIRNAVPGVGGRVLTLSAGIAVHGRADKTRCDALLERAERTLARARAAGGNRILLEEPPAAPAA
ncbi:MAG TPA: GGDEF domain-containing protein [Thermoanaerobaculia bacterium]|nr:GGDEF domain-containing protein [Thermoanaerobaculia bacterium]